MTDEPELLDAETEGALLEALRAAARPGELDPGREEALLEQALGGGAAGSPPGGPSTAEGPLATALRAAWKPAPLPEARHEALLDEALQGDGGPTREDADDLREALMGRGHHPLADLAASLRHAAEPTPPSELALRRAERALRASTPVRRVPAVAGVLGAALALAAATALWLRPAQERAPAPTAAASSVPTAGAEALAASRSLAPLFDGAFDVAGTTARMDRIHDARARELRDNRFAAWGAR